MKMLSKLHIVSFTYIGNINIYYSNLVYLIIQDDPAHLCHTYYIKVHVNADLTNYENVI